MHWSMTYCAILSSCVKKAETMHTKMVIAANKSKKKYKKEQSLLGRQVAKKPRNRVGKMMDDSLLEALLLVLDIEMKPSNYAQRRWQVNTPYSNSFFQMWLIQLSESKHHAFLPFIVLPLSKRLSSAFLPLVRRGALLFRVLLWVSTSPEISLVDYRLTATR